MLLAALVLAAVWGIFWAIFLQFVPLGQFLAARRTWITVVIGIGVDLLIAALVVPWQYLWPVAAIVTISSLCIIARSLANEWTEAREVLNGLKNQTSE